MGRIKMKTKNKHGKWVIPVIVAGVAVIVGMLGWLVLQALPGYLNIYLIPPNPYTYGKTALEKIDIYGLYADSAEWREQYPLLLAELKACESYEDTYAVIARALLAGGGKHSFLEKPGEEEAAGGSGNELLLPEAELSDGILRIKLPAFSGSGEEAKQYAAVVQELIHERFAEIKGAVVDLRDNTGGDLGPMLSALSPLLPDGELLYYHYRQYDMAVSLDDGVLRNAGSGSYILYPEEKLEVPVALLINDRTASSGEAAALSFAGLEGVRSFGLPTAGYTSVNMVYYQYDGARMYLTIAGEKTREGELICEEPILPQEESLTPMEDALAWLEGIM